ncbi:hypothetical protein GCM10017602_17930 [Herbiconiux flava]|nr:hypothetical protein GCM10017602_17930 [Herbiconiux flava]
MRGCAGKLVLLPIALVLLAGCAGEPVATTLDPTAMPSATATATATDNATATIASTPAAAPTTSPAATSALPTSCDLIYSPPYFENLQEAAGRLELNPPWTEVDGAASLGTKSSELLPMLETRDRLDCFWASPSGAGGVGLTTSVSLISPEEQLGLISTASSSGYVCESQEQGTRCSTSHQDATASGGETQFFGGGLWIATFWVEFGPDGYTSDVVATLLP